MNIWKKPNTPTQVDDVIYKRHECEWVLPLAVAEIIKYNERHVPAIIYDVWVWHDYRGTYVQIWEQTRMVDFDFNKLVFAAYSGSTEGVLCTPSPSSSLLPAPQY